MWIQTKPIISFDKRYCTLCFDSYWNIQLIAFCSEISEFRKHLFLSQPTFVSHFSHRIQSILICIYFKDSLLYRVSIFRFHALTGTLWSTFGCLFGVTITTGIDFFLPTRIFASCPFLIFGKHYNIINLQLSLVNNLKYLRNYFLCHHETKTL